MEKLSFQLEVFEGPLDLLLHLIQKNKVSIYDIPICLITDQYLDYLEKMEQMDLEISSSFLVMAARLLYIKSKMLLPKHEELEAEEEEDPRQELIQNLAEYKRYKEIAEFFGDRKHITDYLYFKLPEDQSKYVVKQTPSMDVDRLTQAFLSVMKRLDEKLPPSRMVFSGIVGREPVSVKSKIKAVSRRIRMEGQVAFDDLFEQAQSRSEIVAIFLAVLELIRNSVVETRENNGAIILGKNEA